jgi:hypothetical protein
MLQPSHVSSGLSRVSGSSIRPANASYVPESPPVDILAIPYAKVLPSSQLQMESP